MNFFSVELLQAEITRIEKLRRLLNEKLSLDVNEANLPFIERIEEIYRKLKTENDELKTKVDTIATECNKTGSSISSTDKIKFSKLVRDYQTKLFPMVNETLKKAEQLSVDARYMLEKKGTAPDSHRHEQVTAATSTSPQQQQQQLITQLIDINTIQDPVSLELEKQERQSLQQIEQKAEKLHSLTIDVATLVGQSKDDVDKLSKASEESKKDIINGLSELAIAKKREAGKMTTRGATMSAIVGGTIGIIGGPIGMAMGAAAGAAFGATVGSGLTSLSRSSIDREMRRFKEKFENIKINLDGSCEYVREMYENQRWVPGVRGWSCDHLLPSDPSRWTDMEGDAIVVAKTSCPVNPQVPPVSPNVLLEPMEQQQQQQQMPPQALLESEDTTFEVEDDHNLFDGEWIWDGPWLVRLNEKEVDIGGWQYAFSFAPGTIWAPSPGSTSFVRRRVWQRKQVLEKNKAKHLNKIMKYNLKATKFMQESVQISRATLEELKLQGKEIDQTKLDAEMINTAAFHAERVARASQFTGMIRNVFSSGGGGGPNAISQIAERTKNESATTKAAQPEPLPEFFSLAQDSENQATAGEVDALYVLVKEQLSLSEQIHYETLSQNEKLDFLSDQLLAQEEKMKKLNKNVF